MPHRRTRDTEPINRMLFWAVQSQGQWRSINTELSPDRHRRWPLHSSECCSELCNHKASGDPSILNCPQTDTEDDHSILRKEVEAAGQSLKKGKSAGVDNIPAELAQASGEAAVTAVTTICIKIRQTGEWPYPWTQSLIITLPKKTNLQQYQNYWTIILISHPNKVMLKIRLNRLKLQVEKTIAEEQAGFRTRSTTQQLFKLRIPCLQHQQDLYHVFMDLVCAIHLLIR